MGGGIWYRFNPVFGLNAGLSYFSIGGIQQSISSEETTYGFGFSSKVTTVNPHRMHLIDLPVQATLSFAKRHHVLFGVSVSALLDVKSDITLKQIDDFNEQVLDESDSYGYKTGIPTFSFALNAAYEFKINKFLNLGARYNYGLTDMADNNYFDSNEFDRNTRLTLYLKYNLF